MEDIFIIYSDKLLIRLEMSVRDLFIPQDTTFYDLFEEQAEIAVDASAKLVALFEDYTDVETQYRALKDVEHKGDATAHKAFEELNRTFITPLEPEEISRLVTALDDVVDFIDEGARLLLTYDIKSPDNYMLEFAKCIHDAAKEIQTGVGCLRSLKETEVLKTCCIEINRLENVADDLLTAALKNLFKSTDPIEIIKFKDIYEHFETSADKCEEVASALTAILIRHS